MTPTEHEHFYDISQEGFILDNCTEKEVTLFVVCRVCGDVKRKVVKYEELT